MHAQIDDHVWFKKDIEGYGKVLEIQTLGRMKTYVIGEVSDRDCSPWHPMARVSHQHRCTVVYVSADEIFVID